MRKLITVIGVVLAALMIAGLVRDNNPSFKVRCAAYQEHIVDALSFPDKMVCLTWYQIKN